MLKRRWCEKAATLREKRFTLRRSQREELWRRFTQTDYRRIAERLHAILLLDSGQNAAPMDTRITLWGLLVTN